LISFKKLEVLKGKPTKSIWIMTHVKLLKTWVIIHMDFVTHYMLLEQKIWKTNKNCNSYGLMKIWSNFNHSKVPNYQTVKVFKKKISHMNLSSCIRHILSLNNKFGMWINRVCSILWCFNHMTYPYFSILKVHYC
jgi:hypothetical protein